MFCAGYNPYFSVMLSLLNSDNFSVRALFLQLHFMLIFTALLRFILSFNSPWYFPEKSGIICFIFVIFLFNIQWIFILIFFRKLSFWAVQFVFVIYSDRIIHLFIHLFPYYLFVYFFIGLILLSCLAVLIYLFISCSLFLLNCANSVLFLCAV